MTSPVRYPETIAGIEIIESEFFPPDVFYMESKHHRVFGSIGAGEQIARRCNWAERCPVLMMGAEDWRCWIADNSTLTPGEWLERERQKAAWAATRKLQDDLWAKIGKYLS